MRSRKC